jgi:hypothetical protein
MITSLSEEHPRPGLAGLSQTWALDPTSSWLNGKATVKCSKCMSAMPLYHTCLSSTQTQVLWYNRTSAVIRWAIRELKTITENLPGSAAQHGTNLCRTVWGFLQSLSLNLCWFLELTATCCKRRSKKILYPRMQVMTFRSCEYCQKQTGRRCHWDQASSGLKSTHLFVQSKEFQRGLYLRSTPASGTGNDHGWGWNSISPWIRLWTRN